MSDEQVLKKIESFLQEIRPNMQMDGGDIEFVSYQEGTVFLRLLGACANCPMSFYTLKYYIEERLKEELSDVQEVVTVD